MKFHRLFLFVFCTFFAAFAAAQSPVQERAQRYIETHPNKAEAQRVVEYGMAKLLRPGGYAAGVADDESFFRNAVSRFHSGGTKKALAFVSKKFHHPTELEIAAHSAIPNLWHNRNPFGMLRCGSPAGQPFVHSFTPSFFRAFTLPSTLKEMLTFLTAQTVFTAEPSVCCLFTSSLFRSFAAVPQRSLPLLI